MLVCDSRRQRRLINKEKERETYVLSILFFSWEDCIEMQDNTSSKIASLLSQDRTKCGHSKKKVAERIIGLSRRNEMKCRNAMIKTDTLPGSQLRALREGKKPILSDGLMI